MRHLHPSDVVAIAALLLIGLLVALVSGGLNPLLDFLNTNSGAVMAVAATVTALATGALAWLNRSTLKLYELERKRDAANQVRLEGRCRHALDKVDQLIRGWRNLIERVGIDENLPEEEREEEERRRFKVLANDSRESLKDIKNLSERWAQECRDPKSTRKLGQVRRSARERQIRIPLPKQGQSRQMRDRWAEVTIDQLEPLQELLQATVETLESDSRV